MKAVIFVLALVAFAFAGPAKPARRYFPEEENPDLKRFIYIENENGEFQMIDLKAAKVNKITPRASLSDVEYYFYSLKNRASPYLITNNNVNLLKNSYFDPSKLTMFVVHGWNNNKDSAVNTLIRDAVFAANLDINLFIVDWSGPANSLYLVAKGSVVSIGQFIGDFINQIQAAYGIDGSSFTLVGHSLGAHVVGSAGATASKKVANIIGLDPAGPLFSLGSTEDRLDTSDGQLVQVIHTNGYLLGFASSIGDIDYFPNGGMGQPGCGLDLAGTCAHSKAYKYFAEAITRGPVFQSVLCSNYDQYQKGLCANNEKSLMGEIQIETRTFGDYYLDTNADEPFGKG